MRVGDIMTADVKTCSIDHTFSDAARVLHDNAVASVLIVDAKGALAGIVTERDLTNVVADGLDPARLPLAERMSTDLLTVEPGTDIAVASRLMAERRIRHLPVMDGDALVGIVSVRDLWRWALGELTGGHELPDLRRAHEALNAAAELHRRT
jgi:CBS domain-containing protein